MDSNDDDGDGEYDEEEVVEAMGKENSLGSAAKATTEAARGERKATRMTRSWRCSPTTTTSMKFSSQHSREYFGSGTGERIP